MGVVSRVIVCALHPAQFWLRPMKPLGIIPGSIIQHPFWCKLTKHFGAMVHGTGTAAWCSTMSVVSSGT
eukprot:176389-Amphidinium_carterae.1